MVKINGKEYTEEQLANLMKDFDVTQKALKQTKEQLKDKDELEIKLKEAEATKQELEKLKATQFEKRFQERKQILSKFLEGKDDDRRKSLLEKLGNMDDDDFDDFKEGKTNEEIEAKLKIDSEKQSLETKEKDLETRKKEIIEEALKNMKKEGMENELLNSADVDRSVDKGEEDRLGGGLFPSIDKVKQVYNLDNNSVYKSKVKPHYEKRAETYLDLNYIRDGI
jgi:hypothetical protein